MKQEIKNNEQKMLNATFWDDAKAATSFVQHNNEMKETINTFESLCKTNEEMIEYIQNIDERFDKQEVIDFKNKFMCCCDGHSTERILALIK